MRRYDAFNCALSFHFSCLLLRFVFISTAFLFFIFFFYFVRSHCLCEWGAWAHTDSLFKKKNVNSCNRQSLKHGSFERSTRPSNGRDDEKWFCDFRNGFQKNPYAHLSDCAECREIRPQNTSVGRSQHFSKRMPNGALYSMGPHCIGMPFAMNVYLLFKSHTHTHHFQQATVYRFHVEFAYRCIRDIIFILLMTPTSANEYTIKTNISSGASRSIPITAHTRARTVRNEEKRKTLIRT